MNGINLLKYHDKSFSELHRLMHGEIEDEQFNQLVLSPDQEKTGKLPRKKLSPIYLVALFLTMCAGAVSYLYYNSSNTPADLITPTEKTAVETAPANPPTRLEREGYTKIGEIIFLNDNDTEQPVVLESSYVDTGEAPKEIQQTPEIKSLDVDTEPQPRKTPIMRGTYVSVAKQAGIGLHPDADKNIKEDTEKSDTTPEKPAAQITANQKTDVQKPSAQKTAEEKPITLPKAEPKKEVSTNTEVKKEQPTKQEPKREAIKTAQQTKTPVVQVETKPKVSAALPANIPEKKYTLEFSNVIGGKRYSILTNALKSGYRTEETIVEKDETSVWRVYKLVPGAKIQIAGRGVEFVADLPSQELAVEYVKKNNIPAAIKQVKIENSVYNITVCCMTEEAARKFVENNRQAGASTKLIPVP